MGSGLSMASVNKIKELAEAKEYSLAVEILDSQDLEKSLNPQFFRTCGEVYEQVGRMKEARNMYVKAHVMGPESGRIVFSLIQFYLKVGYRKLAEEYREQYVRSLKDDGQGEKNTAYVFDKAAGADLSDLQAYLDPYYIHQMDEEWSFELFLLETLQGHDTEILASDYKATFRKRKAGDVLQDVLDGKKTAEELFYIYAKEEKPDTDPDEEGIRAIEKEQLRKDYMRLHPELEAKIQEDEDTADETSDEEEAVIIETPDTESRFKSFLKRKFRRNDTASEETDETSGDEGKPEEETDRENAEPGKERQKEDLKEGQEKDDSSTKAEEAGEKTEESASTAGSDQEESKDDRTVENTGGTKVEIPTEEVQSEEQGRRRSSGWMRNLVGSFGEHGRNKEEMQEITAEGRGQGDASGISVSVDFDDGFAPESDTIADLAPEEEIAYENPFDVINAYKIAEKEKAANSAYRQEDHSYIRNETEEESETESLAGPEGAIEEEGAVTAEDTNPAADAEAEIETEEAKIEEAEVEAEAETGFEEPVAETEAELETEETEIEAEAETGFEEPVVETEAELETEETEIEAEAETGFEEPVVETEAELETEEPEIEAEAETGFEEPVVEAEFEEEPLSKVESEAVTETKTDIIYETEIEEEAKEEALSEAGTEETAAEAEEETEISEKLDEGLLEEERLQKEAEALLASLGIKL